MEAAVAAQRAWEAHAAAKAILVEAEERLGEAEAAAAPQNLDEALPGKAAARHAVTRPPSSLSPVRSFSVLVPAHLYLSVLWVSRYAWRAAVSCLL